MKISFKTMLEMCKSSPFFTHNYRIYDPKKAIDTNSITFNHHHISDYQIKEVTINNSKISIMFHESSDVLVILTFELFCPDTYLVEKAQIIEEKLNYEQ